MKKASVINQPPQKEPYRQPCLCVVECKHAGIICASNEVPDFEEGEELIFCASNEVLDIEEGEELILYEELIW
ncbi:MAG: hypothetical protein Q4A08_03550 [Bacteroidales bacterium]|nr:hypothetical protein [Bacteroidales bacterium]